MSRIENMLGLILGTAIISAIAIGVLYLRQYEINAQLIVLVVLVTLGLVFFGLRQTRG